MSAIVAPPSPMQWQVRLERGRIFAERDGHRLEADRPGDLWRLVAAAASGPVHLLADGMEVLEAGSRAALAALTEAEAHAVIGRIAYDGQRLSPRWSQVDAMRFLDVAPGSFIATPEALERAAALVGELGDGYWAYDLANALRHCGPLAISDAVLARSRVGPPATVRVPFQRAGGGPPEAAAPLILVYGKIEASVSLYFDGLPRDLRARFRFLRPGDLFSDMGWLASASLVLVIRDFEHMLETGTLALLRELGVPYAWFTDDDLGALAGEARAFSFYSTEAIAGFASGAAAIVTTSPGLAARLHRYHERIIVWPCVYDEALAAPPHARQSAFVVGAFGGGFRHRSLVEDVLPALEGLGPSKPARIYANADLARGLRGVDALPFQAGFRSFIFRWQRLGLRALVHPYGQSANIGNKSPASILAAAYLGAVPVVGDEPAYADLSEADGVLKAGPNSAAWSRQLRRLADPAEADSLRQRLDLSCRRRFDPEAARGPFLALAALALAGGADAQARRWQQACQSEALQRALPLRSAAGKSLAGLVRSLNRRFQRFRRGR